MSFPRAFVWALVMGPVGFWWCLFYGPLFCIGYVVGMYWGPDQGPLLGAHRKTFVRMGLSNQDPGN